MSYLQDFHFLDERTGVVRSLFAQGSEQVNNFCFENNGKTSISMAFPGKAI